MDSLRKQDGKFTYSDSTFWGNPIVTESSTGNTYSINRFQYFDKVKLESKGKKSQNYSASKTNASDIKTAQRHDYGKNEVTYELKNGRWAAKWNDSSKSNQGWYYVADGSTGYDRNGKRNVLKDGKWVPMKSDNTQKPASTAGSGSGSGSNNKIKRTVSPSPFEVDSNITLFNEAKEDNKYSFTLASRGRLKGQTRDGWNIPTNGINGNSRYDDFRKVLGLTTASNTKDYQQALLKYAEDNGITLNGDTTNFADGRWGNQTNTLFNTLYNHYTNSKEKPKTQPEEEFNVDNSAPVGGYERGNDEYNLIAKGNQFNNYASMVNFIKANPDNPFSRDMIMRFGNVDKWDQNDVEKELNVKGKYRRGLFRNGDLYDIIDSQRKWREQFYAPVQQTSPQATPFTVFNPGYSITSNEFNKQMNDQQNKYSFLKPTYVSLKTGGKLITKNPIQRFKLQYNNK